MPLIKQRFFPDVAKKRLIFGYGRVSHKAQHDRGNSLDDQEARIKQYVDMRQSDPLTDLHQALWKRMVIEPKAASAYSRNLAGRPAGRELMSLLNPGDHVVIDKLDRMFRSLEDFVIQMRWFHERGISLHIVNHQGMAMDTGSVMGEMLLKIMAVFAESESMKISERISMARARLRAKKLHGGGKIPWFCRLVGQTPGKTMGCGGKLEFKPGILALMKKLVDAKAKELWRVYDEHYRLVACKKNSARQSKAYFLRDFYLAWQDAGEPDINTLRIHDFVQTWQRSKEMNHEDVAKAHESRLAREAGLIPELDPETCEPIDPPEEPEDG